VKKLALALTLVAGTMFAVDRQVIYQGDLSPLNIVPAFDHGYVIVWDRNTDGAKQLKTISVFGPNGSRLYQTAIGVPNQKYISLLNGAADTDGTVAVVFSEPGGFAVLDPTGRQIHTVLTAPYSPSQICFAPDHSIWLEGAEGLGGAEYMIFRKYSPDGHELGRFVSSSKFAAKVPAVTSIGGRAIRASANGIVALVLEDQPRPHPPLMQWVKLDFEGNLVGQPGQHRYFFPWTLTPTGTIYAKEGGKFVFLDNVSGKWQESSLPRPGSLAGADENGLVFELPDHRTFEWVAAGR
jgi:hypothetical protein